MDCCLEKKIYDRQINKQGMADRVVDECNPDAVLSMKEITNLCFDNDDKVSILIYIIWVSTLVGRLTYLIHVPNADERM